MACMLCSTHDGFCVVHTYVRTHMLVFRYMYVYAPTVNFR